MSISRSQSPTTVALDNMYLRRIGAFDHGGHHPTGGRNIVAYELYSTMNRLCHGAAEWDWNEAAVQHNLSIIADIRAGLLNMNMTEGFVEPDSGDADNLMYISASQFWRNHGIGASMAEFYGQEIELDQDETLMRDAAEVIQDAHLLWNMRDDGDESVGTFEAEMSDVSDEDDFQSLLERAPEN